MRRPTGHDSLLRALVAAPHALPSPHAQALTVAPQQPLPPQLKFGPASPGQITSTPFSGGVSANPVNVVHPPAPRYGFAQADFVAPRYQQAQPLATPSLGPAGPTLTANPRAGLSALIAALAGQGRKVSPGGNIHKFI